MNMSQIVSEREDFLAFLNHRLRNLLLANDRILKLLAGGDFGQLEPGQQKVLAHVIENSGEVDRLFRMVVDIYEYRNGTKILDFAPCELTKIIRQACEKQQDFAAKKGISISNLVGRKCVARCDEAAINVLLGHVIENAIKHARTAVTITAGTADTHVRVAVTDDGLGICEKDLASLFDRFYVQSGEGKYAPVTGIGLCLCSQIAKAHDGTLRCDSKVGIGTTFLLELPVA